MIYAILVAWFAAGMAGFAFWWTTKYDVTTAEIPLLIVTGIVGPFSWAIGYLIHGTRDQPTVLVKKRHNFQINRQADTLPTEK